MRPAIYTRVSTADQSTDSQLQELRAYCGHQLGPTQRGWSEPLEFTDQLSSTKAKRPGLDALMAAVRRRKVDVVIVYRFDRFARSVQQLIEAMEEFNKLGVQFVSLHEQVDTTTAHGRFFFTVFAAIAELERSMIVDRVKSGIAAARARGVQLGRRRVALSAGQADKAIALRAGGASWAEIGAQVGLSPTTVRRIVQLGGVVAIERLAKNQSETESVSG